MTIARITFTFALLLFLPVAVLSQEKAAANKENVAVRSGASPDLDVLRRRKAFLEERLAGLSVDSQDYPLTRDWIKELSHAIENQQTTKSVAAMVVPDDSSARDAGNPQVVTEPQFELSRPTQGATNEITELKLAWTEDHPCPFADPDKCPKLTRTYVIKGFLVEVAKDKDRRDDNQRFKNPLFTQEVVSNGLSAQPFTMPKEMLQTGEKYYWQVFAEYLPQGATESKWKIADNVFDDPRNFKTEAQMFAGLENKGLTLQRAVSGDDATEGAQFGFLKTFNKGTVYTADFALIYNHRFLSTARSTLAFQASAQGSLTSDENESEDALQFRAGAIIDRNLKRNTINHLYVSLAAKHESDQKFRVSKFISENMLTPTFPVLGIGVPFGRPSNPIQFRWRPYFYFDVGRTFKRGDSNESKDTVLRITPRVRAMLTLNFLRRALNMNDTFIFADDNFYYLPLEPRKTRHNMFTSGFVLQVTKDFGFGLTYKSGEAAPKFKHIHTFGGVLTIRFGKEE